ncbi:MAG TPA: ABC transporter permease subunit [Cellvibrionaceae bacterium]
MSESSSPAPQVVSLMPNAEERARLRRVRKFKDHFSRYGVGTAGIAVVGALALIFVYLFSEVAPLLRGSSMDVTQTYTTPVATAADPAVHLVLERYEQIGASFNRSGDVNFFWVDTAEPLSQFRMPMPEAAKFTTAASGQPVDALVVYGFDNGQASLAKHEYSLSYPNDQRLVTPSLTYPLGVEVITLDQRGQPLRAMAVQDTTRGIHIGAVTDDERLLLGVYKAQTNMFTGQTQISGEVYTLPPLPAGSRGTHMLIGKDGRHMVVADDRAQLHYFDIENPAAAELRFSTATERGQTTALAFVVGTYSFVVGTDSGQVSQWFLIRGEDNHFSIVRARDFNALPGAVSQIATEYTRKGFLAADDQGHVGLYYGTSERSLDITQVTDQPITRFAISPINSRLLALDAEQQLSVVDIWNEHPDVSFSSLWKKVWYEGRSEPEYIWQASSGQDDFEAKMSLVPLTIGTLKAAFFAMLFAMPLAIMGAIYTAYFMTPKLRGVVKPSIEIMEALPTVILGFLAGLWLAPFLENHLPAVFSILLFLPLMMLIVGYSWSRLPANVRVNVPEGWEAAILVVPILLTGWACVAASPHVEVIFFDGSMRQWFTDKGITYDQRNALVVGIAMGFAVIPTIFSIAEDAVFNVPRHLTQGSLALGATRWQTVVGVVLPTASPGIFSAVMMGFGRAVGETMIVLMATGNSPITNFNIFEGMRTLSANIAVELPETAINSTHFRVLFLAALVLLALTFVVNTLAEVIRQRLRTRYSNL